MVKIIISEVNLVQDYVKLKNTGASQINLKNWKILDTTPTNQKRHEFIFKKDFFLAPDATTKIWSGIGNDDANNIYQNRKAKIWNNPGDTAELYDSQGNLMDKKTAGKPPIDGRGPAPPKPPTKVTISGLVSDGVCGQGINAHLVFESLKGQDKVETDSDETGTYETELTTGRDYTVTVSAINYDNFSDTINTKVGQASITKNFILNPNLEIELGVDSTELKFTRKDDNLVNVVKQLVKNGNITVDINTEYTFIIKIAIKKGMTNYIKAVLAENKNNNFDSQEDNTCRISEDGKNLELTFKSIKHNWKWYKLDWLWIAKKDVIEKTFNYSVSLVGKYGNNQFNTKNPISLGKIVVKVNVDKLDDLFWYNVFLAADGAVIAGMVIALLVALIFASPELAVAVGVSTSVGIAGVAAFIGGLIALAREAPKSEKEAKLRAMDDPPKFDRNYKKLAVVSRRTSSREARIKKLSLIKKAVIISRDRLYSAYIKKDKTMIKKHYMQIKKLLKENELSVGAVTTLINKISRVIQKNENYFGMHTISKARAAFMTGVISKKLILRKLNKYNISSTELRRAVNRIKNKKIKDSEFLLLPTLRRLSRAIVKANNYFERNVKKEVRWYLNF